MADIVRNHWPPWTGLCKAKDAGIFVISSSLDATYGFKFQGLGRSPLADPNYFYSYDPGVWWATQFYAGQRFTDRLLIPMDSRTTAGPGGLNEFVFYRQGGWSWSIPYLAGMYALAAQLKPTITPGEFWALTMKTGQTIPLKHESEMIPFGPILDPVALDLGIEIIELSPRAALIIIRMPDIYDIYQTLPCFLALSTTEIVR